MFSMGGNVPGHHGVGITSGMAYNKGGRVGFAEGMSVGDIAKKFKLGETKDAAP